MDRRSQVISACLVGLIAWLLTTHYIPASRFIVYSLISGAALVLVSVVYLILTTARDLSSSFGVCEPSSSFLYTTTAANWKQELVALHRRSRHSSPVVYRRSSPVSEKLDILLNLISKDFVESWYSKITTGTNFTHQVDRALRISIHKLIGNVFQVDLADLTVTRILPKINNHIKAYIEAERQVRGKKSNPALSDDAEIAASIADSYNDGKLHPAVSHAALKTTVSQQQHLRRLAAKILPIILPKNMQTSPSVLMLVQEIVACAVLLPIMLLISDPDVLNQLIEAYGRSVMYEQKTVKKLRAALEENTADLSKGEKPTRIPRLTRDSTERAYEAFVRAIKDCDSIIEIENCTVTIQAMIKRENSLPRRDTIYLKRLEWGRQLLDQQASKLTEVGGPDYEAMSLRELLYDTSGLSYFMEYMDRSQHVSLVQFWIVVDSFRNSVGRGAGDTVEPIEPWTQLERDQLVQISGKYLWRPELKASQFTKDAVHTFINAGEAATNQQYIRAKRAVYGLQDAVYQSMQMRDFEDFKQSDLWARLNESGISVTSKPLPNGTNTSQIDTMIAADPLVGPRRISNPDLAQLKRSHLRRAAVSSSDIANASKKPTNVEQPRRSLDDARDRKPLFDEDLNEDPLASSIQSLDSNAESTNSENRNRTKVLTAMQAALDEIVDQEPEQISLFSDWALDSPSAIEPVGNSFEALTSQPLPIPDGQKPSLSSLGLIGTPSKRTVFTQDDLFGDGEKMSAEGDVDVEDDDFTDDDIREAAPGDLGLSELVESLSLDIEKLEAQQKVLNSLMQKAELTNNSAELRILRKSKTSLEREIHRKELQRQQYIVQKSENDLYGKAEISIKSIMVGTETDGHEFALYVVEVQRFSTDEQTPSVTWAITRRYSEFHTLHRRLRKRYPSVRDIEFPRRKMVLTLQKDFLKKRSAALQKYLRELLKRPQICRSIEFRAFLSQQTIRPINNDSRGEQVDKQDFVTRIYNSVTDGMEEFMGNMPILDQLSTAGQNLITAAITSQPMTPSASELPSTVSSDPNLSAVADNPQEARRAAAEISAYESRADPEMVTFIQPICALIVELFQLNTGQNWLRGRAVVVVTQQLLGGTIERKVREAFKQYSSEEKVCSYLDLARDMLWPGGKFRESPPDRADEEKEESKRNAAIVLSTVLPELAGGVVGRGNAQSAGRRLHAALNNERLNRHLAFIILDEAVDGILGVRLTT